MGLEGIMSKDRARGYCSWMVKHWLKIKNPEAPGTLSPSPADAKRSAERLRAILECPGSRRSRRRHRYSDGRL
jgi:hypothetical protein